MTETTQGITHDGQHAASNGLKPRSPEEAATRIADWLRLFVEPGQVTELRAVNVRWGSGRPHVEAGFFDYDHLVNLAKDALRLTRSATGIYFTLNPLTPDLLARRCNRVDWAGEGLLAGDRDVLRRRWLLVDADPVRDPLISATEAEKARALETIFEVRDFLRSRGWPDPIVVDSGNGAHAYYRIDLPGDDGGLVKRTLHSLAARFDTDTVKIDRKVFNASRITKVPGTLSRKGDHTPDRPHRRSKLLEVPR